MRLFGAAHRVRAPTLQWAFRSTAACHTQGFSGDTPVGTVASVDVNT